MEFGGTDIIVAKVCSERDIQLSVALALDLDADQVHVIHDSERYPTSEEADVVCIVVSKNGDFKQLVSINSDPRTVRAESMVALVGEISKLLNVSILVPDDGSNPYLMWLVHPSAEAQLVSMDTKAYDEERYIIEE